MLNIGERDAHLLEHDEVVVHQVASLINEAVAIAIHCLDNTLRTLLAHLLGNGLYAFNE